MGQIQHQRPNDGPIRSFTATPESTSQTLPTKSRVSWAKKVHIQLPYRPALVPSNSYLFLSLSNIMPYNTFSNVDDLSQSLESFIPSNFKAFCCDDTQNLPENGRKLSVLRVITSIE